jgi:GNAT superfamily N-acetyltransferase
MTDGSLQLEKAKSGDIPRIWDIICQGREQMRLSGSQQWQDGYPAAANINADVASGYGYVLRLGANVIAYAAVIFDGEPAYGNIKGHWLADQPYATVHRLAVADEMKHRGIATLFMRLIENITIVRGITSIRVDTNFDNHRMNRILSKLGYVYCGEVVYDRNRRMAYEKILLS